MGSILDYRGLSLALFFIFGAPIGSFLNVCIYRLPRGESIVHPGSHCPACGVPIEWFDNIPFMSFLFLRGKCRGCKGRISPRYFGVEFITAAYFLFAAQRLYPLDATGNWARLALALCFGSALIVVTCTDLDHRIIPDLVSYPLLIVGLAASFVTPGLLFFLARWETQIHPYWGRVVASFAGLLAGGGLLYLIAILGEAIFKKEAMGGGDIKLMAFVGAFLGWQMAFLTIFLGALSGSVIGLGMKLKTHSSYIPFGPFLALGALVSLYWGGDIIAWYFGFFAERAFPVGLG